MVSRVASREQALASDPPQGRQRRPLVYGLLVAVLMTAAPGAYVAAADEAPLPDPLTLAQALGYAPAHPRVLAGADAVAFSRRQPLYLGCHSLAFSGARGQDDARNDAWSPLLPAETSQRLEIMQRFFDVLLADLSFARDSEAMAVAYVQYDRASARAELGQFSSLKVAELEAEYQLIRRQRAASEAAQRITRSLLAQALGRPRDLPRELAAPDLSAASGQPPALETVVETALRDNAQVRQLVQGRSDPLRALVEMEVREQALELLTRLELFGVLAEQTKTESKWRDLKLDESRTMYELEVKADLGFSMSQQTKARRAEEQVALCRALTWAELNALQGKPVP